ncbi:MAG: hypothetical protein A3G52_03735 [Candidatus Taylorbacteria bacterium RIFCSPLOWO2_12_FULL_43_20]|uniref:Probable DNA 3'-5' helicase RecG n=1 Tax=Candidatus Taylorbacteria bacterium RIFCSPLOWO2_12_FULL_43_20 TaxID=1802332 RepID=A0A1G2P3J0_9BACT|nr:MAG: hypothetical protein A2825_00715 [Candidatus Taylorbacteria bacterium RIFCSPHIGHO2_01_FULL_43_120]OHA22869.1 MAG: hypothetical protein A3B98_01590 [Candidatus Taylorbacteria bacterium RIFCSPHIGHO2_02_FULL_43_55]OHA29348.1 MAG: hypothetical protein A3E92_02305 [Candidatus Taylorbacteria bacterium RIFCSPHIGHO2_12_FULL_42_34]OHA31725.1 MAG: hypothetical protein A3B09_01750 [Candidatus Taylorbacteria bacterium RIFCSPLOWO2_01_FULL_43_83]OHA38776.1 MAG: hypothetical protein A3H58_01860 [Candi
MILGNKIEDEIRVGESQRKALKKLGLFTLEDLIRHFPSRYGDTSEITNISSLESGKDATVFGKISHLKTSKAFVKKIPMAEAVVQDDSGKIKVIWFNQPYIAKMIAENSIVRVEGRVSKRRKSGEMYFSNPKIEKVEKLPTGVGDSLFGPEGESFRLYPVYSESRGITSNWIFHAILKILKSGALEQITDPLPREILDKYHLPALKTCFVWIHSPKNKSDALSARKRFAFEEVFLIQLERLKKRAEYRKKSSFRVDAAKDDVEKFKERFAFRPTSAQNRAVEHIFEDFKRDHPMMRLLEGDVGSGKTFVAAITAYSVTNTKPSGQAAGRLQTAYMCPTEILAKQHFLSFIQFFRHMPINIALITGKKCLKFPSKINPSGWTQISKPQLLKWAANGEIAIVVGTHALIQKNVKFKHLAYVIIDEQHRFGVSQRQKLPRKGNTSPHLLSMTATPIPRTLALTVFGDLDLTLLDEMPAGRRPIITEIIPPHKREETYGKIRAQIQAGRQAYVICPRIDEPDPDMELAVQAKSAKAEARRLKEKVFPEYNIAVLHGKMTPDEKEKVMNAFNAGSFNILVATSVVEVGVNVPNATVIIIEGAERFGLAQLHQLRGRVIRSNHQAYCYVFTESTTEKTMARLKALKDAKNGFELAEYDLKFRGSGELGGTRQWGVTDVGMEALKNIKMVEAARVEAVNIVAHDENLEKYPLLKEHLEKRKDEEIHFE